MSNQDFVDEAFHQFVQQFNMAEQKVLWAFYRELVGKRKISYKIKERKFIVNIQMTQSFSMDVEFQDVLIEDGRHPKEIFMESLRGERLSNGRYRLTFLNRLGLADGQEPKESSFSFSSVKGDIRMWDYKVHTMPLKNETKGMPWNLIYEALGAIDLKRCFLGEDVLNDHEIKALKIYDFLCPYLQLYLDPMTKIGFGKSTVLYTSSAFNAGLEMTTMKQAAVFFDGLGMKRLSGLFLKGECNDRELIQELLYTMYSIKGNIIYRTLKQLIDACGKDYPGLYEYDRDMRKFHAYIKEKIQKIFTEHGWSGTYPSYMMKVEPNFVEVSNVYKRQYAYLNEKAKFIYFDFVETITDGELCVIPVTGMILPKNANIDYRKRSGLECFFFDGGRRNGAIIEDLAVSESMTVNEIRCKMKQFAAILDNQTGC